MKNCFKNIISFVIVLLISVNLITVSASNEIETIIFPEDYSIESVGNNYGLGDNVDLDEFRAYLLEQLMACNGIIDVSQFKIPGGSFLEIYYFIEFAIPEAFHFDRIYSGTSREYYETICILYNCTGDEFKAQNEEFQKVVEDMVDGIKGNNALSDVEKALLLHDRLALKCEYDYTYSKRSAYDALVDGAGVCESYGKGYSVLLNAVGIKNEACLSEELNHLWNIVYIDETPYHVDVTWDDLAWDNDQRGVLGLVEHDNFLRSTEGFIETNHTAEDYTSTPTDTTYDNYFWQKSQSAFILLGDDIYYIDKEAKQLKKMGSDEVLCNVSDIWEAGDGYIWRGIYSRLATDGENLYYSLADAVYKFDVESKTSEKIFEPELQGIEAIYGMVYEDGYIICDINVAPPYGGVEQLRQVSYLLHEIEEPTKETDIVISLDSYLSEENGYLLGVKEGTLVSEILSQLENKDAVVCDKDGNVLGNDDLCKTGCVVKLAYDNTVVDSLTVAVSGDVDGNGVVDATDYIRIKSVFLNNFSVEGEYFLAADVAKDNVLDATDFLRIKSVFLGI